MMPSFMLAYFCIGIVQVARVDLSAVKSLDDLPPWSVAFGVVLCLLTILLTWPLWLGRSGL
jgi:hypothetical protein